MGPWSTGSLFTDTKKKENSAIIKTLEMMFWDFSEMMTTDICEDLSTG